MPFVTSCRNSVFRLLSSVVFDLPPSRLSPVTSERPRIAQMAQIPDIRLSAFRAFSGHSVLLVRTSAVAETLRVPSDRPPVTWVPVTCYFRLSVHRSPVTVYRLPFAGGRCSVAAAHRCPSTSTSPPVTRHRRAPPAVFAKALRVPQPTAHRLGMGTPASVSQFVRRWLMGAANAAAVARLREAGVKS